ncbi:FecR family protein [Sphingobacterium spiritivorum]|uniref:FecR family protein n=1 Tax=Sphingobacterium spiritivorum TaxID=258 RepID=UPI003DA41634
MKKEEVIALLDRYQNGTCSAEEKALVESWYNVRAKKNIPSVRQESVEVTMKQIWSDILVKAPARSKSGLIYIFVAAAMVLIVSGVFFFSVSDYKDKRISKTSDYTYDIAPGGNQATLTTADGTSINLNTTKTGLIINQKAVAYSDGTKVDALPVNAKNEDSQVLQISTPRGGTYSVTLQDGTKVWLNADSKLEFLSSYNHKTQRIVTLRGEAYFEVAQDKSRPFIVKSEGQNVIVLGTHFNIRAYKGEAIKTTLLEGRVKVNGYTMKPNQQAILRDKRIDIVQVDANEMIAWKNSDFIFKKQSLYSIMQSISRWYDVDVNYDSDVDLDQTFSMLVSGKKNLSQVLLSISNTGKVKFKLKNKTIQVSK